MNIQKNYTGIMYDFDNALITKTNRFTVNNKPNTNDETVLYVLSKATPKIKQTFTVPDDITLDDVNTVDITDFFR